MENTITGLAYTSSHKISSQQCREPGRLLILINDGKKRL